MNARSKSSLVDYSKVSSRPDVRQPSNMPQQQPPQPSQSMTTTATVGPPAVVSAQMDAVMRLMTGREERTIAEKLADSNRPTWEQYKKENHDKLNLDTLDQKQMDDYRKQLDDERDRRMAGLPILNNDDDDNGSNDEEKHTKKKKKKHHRKKKHRRSNDDTDDESSELSTDNDDNDGDNNRRRREYKKKHRKHHDKKKKHRSSNYDYSGDGDDDNADRDDRREKKKRKNDKLDKSSYGIVEKKEASVQDPKRGGTMNERPYHNIR